jgi:hypothetical protein
MFIKKLQTKAFILFITAIVFVSNSPFCGCTSQSKKSEKEKQEFRKTEYKCPMNCYQQLFDKPGKCPSCKQVLEVVGKS